MGDINQMSGSSSYIPAWLRDEQTEGQQPLLDGGGGQRRPNLSAKAQTYLDRLVLGVEDLFHHALAVLHGPGLPGGQRRCATDGVAPHPGCPAGPTAMSPESAAELSASATRGRELAALLDPEDGRYRA